MENKKTAHPSHCRISSELFFFTSGVRMSSPSGPSKDEERLEYVRQFQRDKRKRIKVKLSNYDRMQEELNSLRKNNMELRFQLGRQFDFTEQLQNEIENLEAKISKLQSPD
jgi:septal ring factor EnvC (AmiA/AmiB activator)